jgi:hypothetical protein
MIFDLSHTIISVILTLFFGVYGWFFSLALWIGRETAQAEYKWIQRYGNGKRANMPWWGCADYRVWDIHSFWWNLVLPILASSVVLGVI